ncbi:MAG: tetratricopeptide repeat protein, partial [Planctomycetota bacterium]
EAPRLTVDRTRLELAARPRDLKRLFWKATDAGKLDHVLLSSFNPQSRSWTEVARVADADSWALEIPNSPWEEYRIRLQAIDAAGNAGTPEDVVFQLGPLVVQPVSNLSVPPFVRQGEIPMSMASEGFMEGEFSHYEIYYTLDEGQTWLLAGSTRSKELTWKAPRDGRYGFYSVAVSKPGTGEELPKSGDAPKARCLVDTVAPELVIDAPLGSERYSSSRPLEVVWHGVETHAEGREVVIEWSADDGKTWKPLAKGPLSGKYYWSLDGLSGHQFRLRLSLEDEAGHGISRVSERFSLGPLNSQESLELERLFKKATACRVLGKPHDALEAYMGVLKFDANHAPTHNDMGVTMAGMKRWDEAIKCFQKASGLTPGNHEYLYNLAYAYHVQSMPELAEDAFLRLLTLDPTEPRTHWYLSEIYLSRGDKAKAIEHLEAVARNREGRNQLRPLAIQRLAKLQ